MERNEPDTKRRKKRAATPIPGLARHIAAFTDGPTGGRYQEEKAMMAAIRSAFADKIYDASAPRRTRKRKKGKL